MPCKEDILKQLSKPRHEMDKKLASFSHEVFKWLMNREYKEEKYMFQGRDLRRRKENLKEITFMLYHVIGIIWNGLQKKQPTNQKKKKSPNRTLEDVY